MQYSETSAVINQTANYPNSKLTAQLEYFVNKCMLYQSNWANLCM